MCASHPDWIADIKHLFQTRSGIQRKLPDGRTIRRAIHGPIAGAKQAVRWLGWRILADGAQAPRIRTSSGAIHVLGTLDRGEFEHLVL